MKTATPRNTNISTNKEHGRFNFRPVVKSVTHVIALFMATTIFLGAYMMSPFLPSAYGELEQEHITYAQVEAAATLSR